MKHSQHSKKPARSRQLTRVPVAVLSLLALAACKPAAPPESAGQDSASMTAVQAAPATTAKTYSAEAFYATTSVGMVGSAGHAYSPDGQKLLMSSDSSGVFDAYAQPLSGGAPEQLTGHSWSKVREALAVSWNRFNNL